MKYQVITGIFKGLIFDGHPVRMDGEDRVWDNDTVGNSYPAVNCIQLKEFVCEGSIKVLDVIEAEDKESAVKAFRVKYGTALIPTSIKEKQ